MPGADVVRGDRERDKLTIAEVCADLGISRRTFTSGGPRARRPVHLAAEWHPAGPTVGVSAMTYRSRGSCLMNDNTTFDARVYRTEIYKGSEVTTYKVRWKVGGRLWKEGFRTVAQADSFRSALLTAPGRGRRSVSAPAGRWRGNARRRRPAGMSSPARTRT